MSQKPFLEGEVFRGRIMRVEPSLDALFVHIGADLPGFLEIKDVEGFDRRIHREGGELLVRISKESTGTKGPKLVSPGTVPPGTIVHDLLARDQRGAMRGGIIACIAALIVVVLLLVVALLLR